MQIPSVVRYRSLEPPDKSSGRPRPAPKVRRGSHARACCRLAGASERSEARLPARQAAGAAARFSRCRRGGTGFLFAAAPSVPAESQACAR
eukprot:2666213-Prymnesium_polylepis.2